MSLRNIMNTLWERRKAVARRTDSFYEPKFVIYMSERFYHECMYALEGELDPIEYEFYQHGTIHNYVVHRVISNDHEPYIIAEI